MTDSFLKLLSGRPVQTAATGGGGSGGINYISNPGAETDTTGWSTYADAAGASPVDGTGGSPTVTWTRSTSSPLRNTANFLFTKDAANRQGEGVSYAFTIDRADQAKVLNISFDYEIGSGTYSGGTDSTNSDLTAYIYDVTNAVVIQPAPFKLNGAVVGTQYKFSGTFQAASNSTSYRLILHVATTSASAYTVKFDNFNVGPEVLINGTPVTDWTAFTPTGSFTTNTTYTGFWRRVGDSMEIQVRMDFTGAPNATTLSINLPSGYSIDTSRLVDSTGVQNPLGQMAYLDSGTDNFMGAGVFPNDTTSVRPRAAGASGTYVNNAGITETSPITWASGDKIIMWFRVPILGWSSNVQMSSDTDTRVVAAKYTNTATTSSTDSNPINFSNKLFDTHNAVTTGASTWKFTAPVAGIYEITARLGFSGATPANAANRILLDVNVNGSRVAVIGSDVACETTVSREFFIDGTTMVQLNAGDYIQTFFNANQTASLNGSADHNQICIRRLSGPSLVAATETIAARYNTASGQSISNGSNTIVDFGTKEYDTHGAVTTGGSWKFTAPAPGIYSVKSLCVLGGAAGWTAGESFRIKIFKNNAEYTTIGGKFMETTNSSGQFAWGSTEIQLNAGDFIDIRLLHDNGSSVALNADATLNHVSIFRI